MGSMPTWAEIDVAVGQLDGFQHGMSGELHHCWRRRSVTECNEVLRKELGEP